VLLNYRGSPFAFACLNQESRLRVTSTATTAHFRTLPLPLPISILFPNLRHSPSPPNRFRVPSLPAFQILELNLELSSPEIKVQHSLLLVCRAKQNTCGPCHDLTHALVSANLDSHFGTPSGTFGDRVIGRQRLTLSGSMTCVRCRVVDKSWIRRFARDW
jgi:hypothetical protein